MAESITIKALQDASLDAKSLEEVVNGNESKQVTTRKGETYPSVKKAIKTMFENGGLPATPFKTKALMTASALTDGQYAMVTDDTANNGLYIKTAGAWVKSEYDPLTLSKSYTDSKVIPIRVVDDNRDFNTFNEQATIIFGSPASLPTYLNSPYTYFGIGVAPATMSVTSSGSAVIQVFYGGRTSKLICSRYSADSGATWTDWVRFINSADLKDVAKYSVPKNSNYYLEDGTDILDFISSNNGIFGVKSNASAETMINLPIPSDGIAVSGMLEVRTMYGTIGPGLKQVKYYSNDGSIWYRHKTGTTWVHNQWVKVNTSSVSMRDFITEGTDLLEFAERADTIGYYSLETIAVTSTLTNCPTDTNFIMEVRKVFSSFNPIYVTLTNLRGETWVSVKTGASWSVVWKPLLSQSSEDNGESVSSSQSRLDKNISKGWVKLEDGRLVDTKANTSHALFTGSSMIEWPQNWGQLQTLFNFVPNQRLDGKGGEIAEQIAVRMGAEKLIVTAEGNSIPASGSVYLSETSLPTYKQNSIKPFTGFLKGVHGTFAYSSLSPSKYMFTRTESGDIVEVPEKSVFEVELDEEYLGGFFVVNTGKNNFTNKSVSAEFVFNYTKLLTDHLQSTFQKNLIIGHFLNRGMSATAGIGPEILRCNEMLKNYYGDFYIDTQGYLTGQQVWVDTGITPTETDLNLQSLGLLANRLSMDSGHLNEVTWQAFIDNVLRPRMQELGWI